MEEGTYWERVQRLFHMMDIRTAFVSDAEIEHSFNVVQHPEGYSQDTLFRARKVLEATTHPDTKQKILFPLRVSFIVPVNLALDLGMLSATTTRSLVGWQLLNQTYNALHYYANRNASNPESLLEAAQGYIGATLSSVSISVYLMHLSKNLTPQSSVIMRRLIPFSAVAMADLFNLGIVRRNEYLQGVDVHDLQTGELLGKSRIVGAYAVGSCILGRVSVVIPILAVPPMIMHWLETRHASGRLPHLLQHHFPRVRFPLMMSMVGISIQCFCPLVFGIFKQRADVSVSLLEPRFHDLVNSHGVPVSRVSYNKGI